MRNEEEKNIGIPLLRPYDFLSPRSANPKGPYNGNAAAPRATQWKDLYTPFHGREYKDDVDPIGKHAFPVLKPHDFLSPRSSNPLGPYKGGPPPEPTRMQRLWPIVAKDNADVYEWFHS